MKSSITKTQTSEEGEDKDLPFMSDLHYEIVLQQNVKEKIKVKLGELNDMIAEMTKKKEEEAEAQEGAEAQDTPAEEVEKKVDPLESIKTEQDKREWVLKELQIIETTDLQRKK